MVELMQAEGVEKTLREKLELAGFSEILEQPRFVLFKKEPREGKITKIPKMPNGKNATSTDPETWVTFDKAYAAFVAQSTPSDGMGIILGDFFSTKIVGLDLDHVTDALSGEFTNAEAAKAVEGIQTYGERSPSGTGVHFLFLNQDIPTGFRTRTGADAPFDMELYERGRYFTISGDAINSNSICTDEASVERLCKDYLKKKTVRAEPTAVGRMPSGSTGTVGLERALELDSAFHALFGGQRPTDDESANDMSLMNYLARYIGRNAEQMIAAFVESPFYATKDAKHKQKCEGRDDYLQRTADNAIASFFAGYSFDDVGNTAMFVDTYGDEFVYSLEWEDWLRWNGKKWEARAELAVQSKVVELSDTFRMRAAEMRKTGANPELLPAMEKHSKKFRELRSITAVGRLARSSLMQSADIFDADPLLVNCQNGIFSIKENKLLPHSAAAFCTNLAGAAYDPAAACPGWLSFLNKILPAEGADFLQQCVGMAAVGRVYEEAMVFMIGHGANGKSTIANILSAVFGDYALTLQPDVITATKDGKTPPDFACVRGKRIVFLSETEEGDRLSTKALKRLSSNETVAARRLYAMPETFEPSHTVFYSTNHKPRIGSGDHGTWRRIKHMPFDYSFSEDEKIANFAEQLLAVEADGIFSWCMAGAVRFAQQGFKLVVPQFVVDATEEYKSNEDVIANFISERCDTGYDAKGKLLRAGSAELYTAYKDYCKEGNYFCKSISDFNNCIAMVNGISRINVHGTKVWQGLRVRTFQETIDAANAGVDDFLKQVP